MTTCCGKPMKKIRERVQYGKKFITFECSRCHKMAVENASLSWGPYSPPVGIP